jgi:hypothetical protein
MYPEEIVEYLAAAKSENAAGIADRPGYHFQDAHEPAVTKKQVKSLTLILSPWREGRGEWHFRKESAGDAA